MTLAPRLDRNDERDSPGLRSLALVLHGKDIEGVMAKRKAAKKSTSRKRAAKRELINTGSDKRYVRRGPRGRFTESDDVGRSLAGDPRKRATRKVKSGQGDRGDRT